MNDLLKNPLILGGVVLILVVVAVMGKASGPTYAVTATDPAAFKERADAQAITDGSLTSARGDIMQSILGYSKQRDDYRVSMAGLRDNYNLSMAQLGSAERLGMAGLQSNERLGMADIGLQKDAIASQERQNQQNNETQRQNGILGFFGNIFSGILGLFL